MTVLDHLLTTFHSAAIYNRHDLAKPSVILWTDGARLWEGVAGDIAAVFPGFFQLDDSEIDGFRGPSTWIRYQLGKWSGAEVPVVYLPGIHRHQFRGAAGFPEEATHLYALQFQGQFCSQLNGKDWTPLAFLSSGDGGLGLDVAKDRAAQKALGEQLKAVLRTPVEELRGRHLEASDFHDLAVGDPVRMLFDWMNEQGTLQEVPESEQSALMAYCTKELGFDLKKDGILPAAEKLAAADGKWAKVWSRFEEAAASWPGIQKALDLVQPDDLFSNSNLRIPAVNRKLEDDLRNALVGIGSYPSSKAKAALAKLADENADRAKSVWARLDQAPLANAAIHLGKMVTSMNAGLSGTGCKELAESYLTDGWRVDAEARKAWAAIRRKEDCKAMSAALRAAYLPWLEDVAGRVQKYAGGYPMKSREDAAVYTPEPGTVIVFVDGLRADVAKELEADLADNGMIVAAQASWSALPTVTATAKPAWRPLADSLCGTQVSETYEATIPATGKLCKTAEFRKLLKECGWPWIPAAQTGDPTGSGWTEIGSLDTYGHEQGAKLAWRVREELNAIRQRIEELLDVGWRSIRVVTDHGWLWMPGNLPKVDLPKHLTVSKWGRCARPDPQAVHEMQQISWFWGNEHPVVLAPGISVFMNGVEYAHGGLTLQEALTLSLEITNPNRTSGKTVAITGIKWVGLRLKVEIAPADSSVQVDIRLKAADPDATIFKTEEAQKQLAKGPDDEGRMSLFIEDDSQLGQAAILVLLRDGQVIAKKTITIGED